MKEKDSGKVVRLDGVAKRERKGRLSWWMRWGVFGMGLGLMGWGIDVFFRPNQLITGGLPGLSLLLEGVVGWDASILIGVFTVIFLGLSGTFLGWRGLFQSLLGGFGLALSVRVFEGATPLTDDLLLAAIFGGGVVGFGLGLVFWSGFSIGGFAVLAQLLNRWFGVPVGRVVLICDASVVTAAGVIYEPEAAMYALVAVVTFGWAIDFVQTGFKAVSAVQVITDRPDLVRPLLIETLDCGVTILEGEGGMTGGKRFLFLSVVPRMKVARIRRRIRGVDPGAFVIVASASEVLGYGFETL